MFVLADDRLAVAQHEPDEMTGKHPRSTRFDYAHLEARQRDAFRFLHLIIV
ncbi:hypothetical protein [Sphingomonas sp. CROZ-RG-20F-R02-07]|uniref:hypothetical protein n=1 Tax=Sphingomonas sp. CROZ-RG-20F-R02-07 TaxID=2914832 RepID=UPI001F56EEE1|nr:hypothetical protein [Sphingomonas sp. CROZ-RG-20F-R02-07]